MADAEKTASSGGSAEKEVHAPPPYHAADAAEGTAIAGAKRDDDFWTRNGLTLQSFKRRQYGEGIVELDRTMKPRHLHMIAIGGSIGAGFFVGSGSALSTGGPASLLIDFILMGIMIFNVVYALGELAIMYPVSGGFYVYASRFIDPSWGFAMGWNYVFQWAIVVPLELTVCSISIGYWDKNESHQAIYIAVFWIFIIFINVFGTLGYAEEEFWSAIIKLTATVVFILIAFICVLGGGPAGGRYDEYYGARLFYDPGSFNNGFQGFCSVFVTAAFAFSGTELVGLAAAETPNPVASLPSAIKQVFWRITLFYVLGLMFIGLLIPYDDKHLLGASDNESGSSPFVLVGRYAGLPGFDHFMNVIILVSVVSIGVSGVYGGSRTLVALAQQGYAPKLFTFVDKGGRPLPAVSAILILGALAFINLNATGSTVFDWFVSLSGLAALFTWGSICYSHIRFRAAWAYHGHTVDELPFKAIFGVYGSWMSLILIFIVLMAQFYVALYPAGCFDDNPNYTPTASGWFQAYLALPVVMIFWIVGYLWKREKWLKLEEIDVDTGRRELDWDVIHAQREKLANGPAWKRVTATLF